MDGIILASKCGTYEVMNASGKKTICKPLGIFRHKNLKPLVGDHINFDELECTIKEIYPRKNHLIRPNVANVDELAIVMSVSEPEFSSLLIDKFVSYANYFKIPACVIISKIDKDLENKVVEAKINSLTKLGIKVIAFSSKTFEGIEEVKKLFDGKVVVLMGQTGVGKSSLLNVVVPDSKREVGEYSKFLGRGKHQTKEVILIPYGTGYIADTPGFSSLELPFYKEDLAKCFLGFNKLEAHCKFDNCLHIHEPDCEVKKALRDDIIARDSYENYLKISNELIFKKDRF